jgi:hypothetical protein
MQIWREIPRHGVCRAPARCPRVDVALRPRLLLSPSAKALLRLTSPVALTLFVPLPLLLPPRAIASPCPFALLLPFYALW